MQLTTDNLIKEYYETIKDEYPNIPFKQIELMCKTPWTFLRHQMRKSSLPIVKFMYLGMFIVKRGVLDSIEPTADRLIEQNRITPRKYEKLKKIVEHHNQNQDESNS